MIPELSTMGRIEEAWLGLLFGLTGIGALIAVVWKFLKDASGGLR